MPRLITTLIFGVAITGLFMFFMLEFIGGYSANAGLIQNATLRSYIAGVNGNVSKSNLFGIANTTNNTQSQSGALQHPTNFFSQITGGIGAAASFIASAANIADAIVTFAALPLAGVGIQIGYAKFIVELIILMSIVLTIISAILIFPI